MNKNFTRNNYKLLIIFLTSILLLLQAQTLLAQCSKFTPVQEVNLVGKPDGSWTSPSMKRNGLCCDVTSSSFNCAQFNIILDSRSGGLQFDIIDGPAPSGSMFYQVDCNPSVAVGKPICVSGAEKHVLTICMPGNASGIFRITSIPAFNPMPDISVTQGCSAKLEAPFAFNEPTVSWKDITGNGTYDKYLNCLAGCSTPTITPKSDAPAYVDYLVCGTSSASLCANIPYCDTVRVYFYPRPQITISPSPAIICPGSNGVDLTGTVTGGSGNFKYIWTDTNGNVVGTNKNYKATTIGTYNLEVRTENYPNCDKFSRSVTVVSDLTVNAGPDQRVCSLNPVQLNGKVTAASGGIWSGGGGTFSPNNTNLRAVYTPTAQELQAGFVKLTLTTTGNGGCSPIKDEVRIDFYKITVNLTGPPVICAGSTASITATVSGAVGTPTFQWNTGETTATISNKPAGTYTVVITDENSCSLTESFTIKEQAGPSDFMAAIKSTTCGNSNGEFSIYTVTGGTAPYTYSKDSNTFQAAATFTNLLAGSYTITVKDANGCTFAKTIVLNDIAGPTAVSVTSTPASCASTGSITAGTITSGTAPFTYSLNGTSFQSSTLFTGLASGNYTLTVQDANKCRVTTTVTVGTNVPTNLNISTVASTCGNPNGELTITGVTGGTAPYTYSKDGNIFQSSTTFNNLLVGSYNITVKDANGCTFAKTITITNIAGPTGFGKLLQASTCSRSNGEITLTSVTGGTAPFTYSKDGRDYQTSAKFTNLLAGTYTLYVKDANGCVYSEEVILNDLAAPVFTTQATASTCNNSNGVISIRSVTGGVAPYTYSKDNLTFQSTANFNNLLAGTYSVTVKDANGCLTNQAVTIQNIAGPTDFLASIKSSTCGSSNGGITVTGVTGGTAPYSYSRDGITYQPSATFANLLARDYSISVRDANGCIYTKTILVNNIAGPTDLAATTVASTCGNANGELTVTEVTGGTAPYTYSKGGNTFQSAATFTNLLAGSYTITVKDANGCTFVKGITVNNIAGPTAITATSSPASCASTGSITAGTVTGGTAPFTYSLNGTSFQQNTLFADLASGNYTLTVKDANNCRVTVAVVVGTNVPTNFTSITQASTCGSNNGELTISGVTGGTAPYTYSKDGVNYQRTATFSALLPGNYSITVKDANGCNFAKVVTVTNNGGAIDLATTIKSPTCANSNGEITISNITSGTRPFTYSKDGVNFQTSAVFTGLPAGNYQLSVKDAKNCVYTESVLLNDVPGPAFTAITQAATCSQPNGQIIVGAVTSGTAPFLYSTDGIHYQSSNKFAGIPAGTYSVRVKDANSCSAALSVVVTDIASPADITLAVSASTCGASNGSIRISSVSGGSAPYSYSMNGGSFQSAAIFTSLAAGNYSLTVKDANGCTFTKLVVLENIAGPTDFKATLKPSVCGSANGELVVSNITGGTAPYVYSRNNNTFQASPTFTGLLAGAYTIVIKDANNCTISQSFTITDVAGPTAITATATPATCSDNDGSITANMVTGGTAPYSYSINNTNFQTSTLFAGLASGTYSLTAKDANGCIRTTSVTVRKNVPTSLNIATVASTCGNSNGAFTINSVADGTAPYTYSKDGIIFQSSTTFNNLLAGSYNITVKDANGCTFTKAITITNIAGPTGFGKLLQASTCSRSNGEITLTSVTGGTAPFTYSKDDRDYQTSAKFTNLLAGTYTIYVKDANGCLHSEEVILNDIAAPTFTAQATASTCGNQNGIIAVSSVTNGTAPYTYSKDGTTFQSATIFNNLLAGTYTITIKDANGCLTSQAVAVENIAGPTELAATSKASTCGNANGELTVTEVTGGTAPYTYSKDGVTYQTAATFANLLARDYSISVRDANGCIYTKTILVNNIAGPIDVVTTTVASTCGNANGELTVSSVTGGTAPYTYSKDGITFQAAATFNNLLASSYTITVKDVNGCIMAKAITVNNIAGPTAVATSTEPATCSNNDGSITAGSVTGGTAPYTFSIDGTTFQNLSLFPGLASGSYTLTIKDRNGCILTKAITVRKNVPTNFTSSTTASTCGNSNGAFTISSVVGGTAPYTYSLDGNSYQASAKFTDLAAAIYKVTVKDANGCTYQGQVQVNNESGPIGFVKQLKSSTCNNSNGEITIKSVNSGAAPFGYSQDGNSYQASSTFTGLSAGAYTIYIKDVNGCVYSEEVILNDIAAPNFTAQATASTCGGSNGVISISSVTGGTAPYTYSKDGTIFQQSASFPNLTAGNYIVRVKDVNGCLTSQAVTIENITGPTDFFATTKPSTCGNANGELTITEVTGGAVPYTYSSDGITFQNTPTFTALRAGEYTFIVKDANGCTVSRAMKVNNITGPTNFAFTGKSSTCGNSDGEFTVDTVTGGTAPYTYSKNGSDFQISPVFSALRAGSYLITIKDANGCTYTGPVAVNDVSGVTALTFAITPSACTSNTGTITINGVRGGVAPYTYSVDGLNFQSNLEFTSLAPATYTVFAKDANGCRSNFMAVVSTTAPQAVTIAVVPTICGSNNGNLTITNVTGGVAPYTYSQDGTTFQLETNFANLEAGAYTITIKDSNGCTLEKNVVVNNVSGPSDLKATLKSPACSNRNGEIAISNVTGGKAPYTYSLDGNAYQSTANFTSLSAGEYTVNVKDANGCIFNKKILLDNVPGPSFTATPRVASCGNSNGSISIDAVSEGVAPYTYSMNGAAYQAAGSFTNLAAGAYTIRVKDANGCMAAQQLIIENNPSPDRFTVNTVPATCGDQNGSIQITSVTNGTAPYSYSLNNGIFQSLGEWTSLIAGEYNITLKDANGCTVSKQVVLNNTGGPVSVTTTTKPVTCGAKDGAISVGAVTGGTAPYQYSLDGLTYHNAPVFTGLAAGNFKIYVKDNTGCQKTVNVLVPAKGPQSAEVAIQSASCGQKNGLLTINTVKGGTGTLTYRLNGGNFQSSNQFTDLAGGTYTLTIKDAEGCLLVVTKNVVATNGLESFTVNTTNTSCGNKNGQLVIGNVTGGQAPYTYRLDGNSYQTSTTFSGLPEGTYQVFVKDGAGCTQTKTAVIQNSLPLTKVDFSVLPASCSSATGELQIKNITGGTAPYSYSLDGAQFTSIPNATALVRIIPGTYNLTIKDARNCTLNVPVKVGQSISKLAYVKNVSCFSDTDGAIAVTTTGKTDKIEYSIDNGATFQKDSVFFNLPKGLYSVIVRYSNSCSVSVSALEVKEPLALQPVVTPLTGTLGSNNTGSAVITQIKGGTRPYSYQIDNGNYTADTLFKNLSAGEHTLLVEDKNGCTSKVAFRIEKLNEIEIPDGFTPNGDGLNDTWELANIQSLYPDCKVAVFNRWGNEVFQSSGYKKPWDGTNKGQKLPDGTYYTIIKLSSSEAPIRKAITIMR